MNTHLPYAKPSRHSSRGSFCRGKATFRPKQPATSIVRFVERDLARVSELSEMASLGTLTPGDEA